MKIAPGALVGVTGATGGIGRRVVRDLVADGFKVRILGRNQPRSSDVAEFAEFDLAATDPPLRNALEGCSAIIHLAAFIPPNQEEPANAELCLRTNALGTLKLMTAMESAGIRWLVQTTSANAYASGERFPSESSAMYPAERAPYYLSSKLVQDVLGTYFDLHRNIEVATLRLSSVYGAGLEASLFARFCRALQGGEAIRLANGGRFGADFVELSDVSSAVRIVLRCGAHGPLNVASGKRTTLLEAARVLLETAGVGEGRLIVEPGDGAETGFPAIDISRAVTLGYAPTDLRTGLEGLADWAATEFKKDREASG